MQEDQKSLQRHEKLKSCFDVFIESVASTFGNGEPPDNGQVTKFTILSITDFLMVK